MLIRALIFSKFLTPVFPMLGCVMGSMAIILIFVPLFAPIVVSQGFDLVWFGIIVLVATEFAVLPPPPGMNVLVLRAVRPSIRQDGRLAILVAGSSQPR
ncbi:TRAP transporter large permease subunit [Marivita sp.]|uniref:TRAP transporter large permease subunit n=1 Tax=Marivita sp. TaxID=2003365 RepID=UPI003B52572C